MLTNTPHPPRTGHPAHLPWSLFASYAPTLPANGLRTVTLEHLAATAARNTVLARTSRLHSLWAALSPAFGVATLCNLTVLTLIVSPTHDTIYHLSGPVSGLIVPALFHLLLLTLLLALLLHLATSTPRTQAASWVLLLCTSPWIALRNIAMLYGSILSHALNISLLLLCLAAAATVCCLWKPARSPLYDRAQRIGAVCLSGAAILGVILTLQTLYMGWQARHLNDVASVTPPLQSSAAHHPLVLWIVFDELSYDQVYGSRYPGLQLPTLDQFAQQSTIFTHVVPAGTRTEAILPSLITGIPDDGIRSTSTGQQLYLHVPATPSAPAHWQPFLPTQTVFARARSLGYHPAIVGWYNPYCRLLFSQLSSCAWADQANLWFMGGSLTYNLFDPILSLFLRVPHLLFPHHLRSFDQVLAARSHIDDYKHLYAHADQTLANPSLDFVFLHMPIPHPFGIYDRRHAVLTTGPSTYIDNLALVDKYLAHLRHVLEQQHQWDDATIVIMGDHSWRTRLLWESGPQWTPEEQRASHGGAFDDRPFFAVKLPHQHTPQTISSTVHALDTDALLQSLLRHRIQTPQQLNAWAIHAR